MLDVKKAGEQIAFLRKRGGYTQEVMAEKLGVSPQAVSKWENGYTMPEVALLCRIADLFGCSVDYLLNSSVPLWKSIGFNYEFCICPKEKCAEYSGPEWPHSIMFASIFTALKLLFGLESRRDYQNRQICDEQEYILQSAITNVCFGYSYMPDDVLSDGFAVYGLDYDRYHSEDYDQESFIALACARIEQGYPVIVMPRDYADTILAVGYTDKGKTLKGMSFLEGDDVKNAGIDFGRLNGYAGWYAIPCDMFLVKPAREKLSMKEACLHALNRGIKMLSNKTPLHMEEMQGYGLVMYDSWRELLVKENRENVDKLECVFPHAFIHYENKLRTKQFFELCIEMIPDIDKGAVCSAIEQYQGILGYAGEIATIAHNRNALAPGELKEKRNYIIELLRRSREQEELALSYLKQMTLEKR